MTIHSGSSDATYMAFISYRMTMIEHEAVAHNRTFGRRDTTIFVSYIAMNIIASVPPLMH